MATRRATTAVTTATLVAALLGLASAGPVLAQDDLERTCAGYVSPTLAAECRLAAGSARVVQPRLAAALWGGNPVAGTASTLGMRIGSLPRFTLGGRVTIVPTTLPPLADRASDATGTAVLAGGSLDMAVGVTPGFSPLPTVGGVLSLDLLARLAYLPLREARGFAGDAWGWSLGARAGILRESFTLPGLAATASFGRVSSVTFGDRDGAAGGFFAGATNDLGLELAASKRLGLVGLAGGVRYDRMTSDVTVGFREFPGAPRFEDSGHARHEIWNAFVNAGTTLLIFHGSVELGWQKVPTPDGLPAGVDLDPIGWYGGASFRVSI